MKWATCDVPVCLQSLKWVLGCPKIGLDHVCVFVYTYIYLCTLYTTNSEEMQCYDNAFLLRTELAMNLS